MENLIANSGIQFITNELEFNPSEPLVLADGKTFKYTFLEYVDDLLGIQSFDYLCYHPQSSVFIPLSELRSSQQFEVFPDGREVIDELGLTSMAKDIETSQFSNYRIGEDGVFSINSLNSYNVPNPDGSHSKIAAFELLLNKWLPMPMFESANDGYTLGYPLGWCRLKIQRIGNGKKSGHQRFRLIWAFDTELSTDCLSDLRPAFYDGDAVKKFQLCNCADEMFKFLAPSSENGEISAFSEYIKGILGNPIEQYNNKYIAYYIYFVNYLRLAKAAPEISLHNNTALSDVPVDLVLDIGNSRTCGVLFEKGDFTRSRMLMLRDLSYPDRTYDKSFDMRFVFRQADFGNDIVLPDENIFKWYSFVRVGEEAKHLVYRSLEQDGLAALATNYSSPKRYLWDLKPFDGHWENLIKEGDSFTVQQTKNIYIPNLSEMFDSNGNYIPANGASNTDYFAERNYSRSSLMTFVLIEIFQQAISQINSTKFRTHHGEIDRRRVLRNIILTCPTAMPKVEQIKLRKCAEDAYEAIRRCIPRLEAANIIPASSDININNNDGYYRNLDWSYDEATCCQLTYLYAEIKERYDGATHKFFNLKGHGNKLTIGSVDIGAGTTDVMICSYTNQGENTSKLTPTPLYWDSFYLAGDDILRNIIQELIIEGEDLGLANIGNIRSALMARIQAMSEDEMRQIPCTKNNPVYMSMIDNVCMAMEPEHKLKLKRTFASNLLHDFFGEDSSGMSHKTRRCRLDFNTQISVPIAQMYMELLRLKRASKLYSFNEIFTENKPAAYLLDYFEEHFGFRFEELSWRFEPEKVTTIVESTLEPLMKQLAVVLYAHHCDIIVLAGRPTSLDAITELFIKYLPTSPDRLVRLNEYRVGKWFPTATGEGYFYDQKSIVATGAMVGYIAATTGLPGLAIDFDAMREKMQSTAHYMGEFNGSYQQVKDSVLSPTKMMATLDIPVFPIFLGCKQFDSPIYQARPLYALYSNHRSLKVSLSRDYREDRETITIEDIQNEQGDQMPIDSVELVQQSLVDEGKYWLDKGAFTLTIN